MSARTVPVIALFGSSDHTDVAEALGAEIARRNCILLTGGGRRVTGRAVTESGLDGAEAARRDDGVVAARIGVLGRRHTRVLVDVEDEETKIVLGLAVGDRRNYVNARLCDVAIALDGGDGTKSEVAFCLALGRPVVLVGPRWRDEFPVTRSKTEYDLFVRAAQRRVPVGAADELDRLITDAYDQLGPDASSDVVHRSLDTPPSELVTEAEEAAGRVGPVGAFPELRDPARALVAETYATWLTTVDERLSAARTA
ncbi:hypothetical protein [Nocardioides astragali]|uniref:Uncharacterized protein n=1 Tax=Nocardioides astragali TaxID=1776736 RepID=A0ABW2NAB2_9ACTN|nr:hypothetical protein [Nocardioides astragali]